MIKAEKLSFGFDSSYLFQNISFTLDKDCHCVLIGSNGTGKTTLTNLIKDPDSYSFEGRLKLDGTGRIGYISQFVDVDGDQSVTVYDYLCRDFLSLEQDINDVCLQMESAEDIDAVMERYQELLDESSAMDADNYEVNIETNGAVPLLANRYDNVFYTMDWKSPSSGENAKMIRENLRRLNRNDVLKFVVGNKEDLDEMKKIAENKNYEYWWVRPQIYVSPIFGEIEPKQIVEYLKENQLRHVCMQVQLHKVIWNPNERGV